MDDRPIAIFDGDDTLFDDLTPFVGFLNKFYPRLPGYPFTEESFTTFNWPKVLGTSREKTTEIVHHFCHTDAFRELEPEPGAVEGIAKIAEKYRPVLSSNRTRVAYYENKPLIMMDATLYQLRHFKGLFHRDDIYLLNNHNLDGTPNMSKRDVVVMVQASVATDDDIENLRSCQGYPLRQAVLYTKPWNKNEIVYGVISRANTWLGEKGIVEKVLQVPL